MMNIRRPKLSGGHALNVSPRGSSRFELERRAEGITVLQAEASGKMAFDTFTLKGRADRIDKLADGTLAIIDYKTGETATQDSMCAQGLEPQLPLLALIAQQGGFEKTDGKADVSEATSLTGN